MLIQYIVKLSVYRVLWLLSAPADVRFPSLRAWLGPQRLDLSLN